MYAGKTTTTLVCYRLRSSHASTVISHTVLGYSTLRASTARAAAMSMFQKAVKDHSAVSSHPLQSTLSHNNGVAQPKPPPPQSIGVKRKIEMTNAGGSALGSLHSAVYFDEYDFDDDDDLDLEAPDPIIPPPTIVRPASQDKPLTDYLKLDRTPEPSTVPPSPREPAVRTKTPSDVKYPELPPVSEENVAPSSSIQYPWSSSPPSHFQKPGNPRTLPWLKNEEPAQPPSPVEEYNWKIKPKDPHLSKQNALWNNPESMIREEQKKQRKMRQQLKKDQKAASHPARPKIASLFLSDEQRHVLDAVVQHGKSIFFTGSAGTGKSVLMREIIKKLRDKYRKEPDRVAVTASTGLAACNIGGVTLHSFAGIGLGKDKVPELVKKIKRNPKARNRWLRTKVLIIDEVSMVDGDLFDKLEEVARLIRNNGRPFGGIQLVVTGDFFQLPPVPEGGNREAKFAFAAATWNTAIHHTILLTNVFRQADPEFAGMLNEMRLGKLSQRTIDVFKQLSRPLNFHDSLEATELFPTRNEVENANGARMQRLSGELMTFTAVDSGTIQDERFREKLLSNCMAPQVIHLKKGAQVMLIKNMEDTLVNGSIGRVVAFMDETTFEVYREHENDFSGTGDFNDLDEDSAVRARKKLKSAINKDGGVVASRKWPLVCFVQPDGTERHLLCQPETWKIELPNGEVQAQRQQIPLILAWALSIHKAQGQTLQRVKVDLGRVFEKGQAYVALSRATSKDGLQVTRFDPRKVMVHPKVTEFYSNLVSITEVVKPRGSSGSRQTRQEEFPDDEFEEDYQELMAA